MKRNCIGTSLAGLLAFATLGLAENKTQLAFTCQIIQLPASSVETLFGPKGAAPGNDVAPDLMRKISQEKHVDILLAPKLVVAGGTSGQIQVGQDRLFTTDFKAETNGVWVPVSKTRLLGVTLTITGESHSNDPERIHGAAELTMADLVSVQERTVQPPGGQAPLKLETPLIQENRLTTSFDARSGKTIVLGGMTTPKTNQVIIILLKSEVLNSSQELSSKLKSLTIPMLEFKEATLRDVLDFLIAQARELDPEKKGVNMVLQTANTPTPPSVTLSLRNISLYETLSMICRLTGATLEFDSNTVIIRLP